MGIQGPAGPQGEPGETLDWSDVIATQNLEDAVYVVGVQVQGKNYILGSGLAALLFIDAKLTEVPYFLSRDQVQELSVGQPIGTIGFPEEVSGEAVTVPMATFRGGTISDLRPFADVVATPENSRIIQHDLDLAGHTSGSLIFDHQGYIVGMNFAGIYRVVYDDRTGEPTRIVTDNPGFALRVDELWRLYDLTTGSGRIVAGMPALRAAIP